MKSCSKKIPSSVLRSRTAFSLPEVVAAMVILAFIGAGVLVVINRCMASAADLSWRVRAFEVARDNMENLLVGESAEEMVEYGFSEKYPEIQWQTVVETFYEPITDRMWVQAVCSAEYMDTLGELQTVQLAHWLTDVSKQQLLDIVKERAEEKAQLFEEGELFATAEEVAAHVGVDVETVQQWVANGMRLTSDGYFIRSHLDTFYEYDGNPPAEAKQQADQEYQDLRNEVVGTGGHGAGTPDGPAGPRPPTGPQTPGSPVRPTGPKPAPKQYDPGRPARAAPQGLTYCGYTIEQLVAMPFDQMWQIVMNCDEF